MSKRLAPVAIISIAQQAKPKVIGHMLDSRAQLIACSSEVVMTLSSNRPSSQPIYPPKTLAKASLVFGQDHQLFAADGVTVRALSRRRALGCGATDPIEVATLP